MCINGKVSSNPPWSQTGNQDGCHGDGVPVKPKTVPGSDHCQPPAPTEDGGIDDYTPPVAEQTPSDPSGFQGTPVLALIAAFQAIIVLLMRIFGIGPGLNGASPKQGVSQESMSANGPAPVFVPSPEGEAPTVDTPSQSSGPSSAGQDIPINGGGPNTITVKNNSSREQNYALFVNPGEGQTTSYSVPQGFVTLKPGESANFKLPVPAPGLHTSGYVQQMNNYTQDDYANGRGKDPDPENFKATRAEYTFDHDGTLWFNTSHILGYNAALVMRGNENRAGSDRTILSDVQQVNPGLVRKVGDQYVIVGPQGFDGGTNDASALILNQLLNGSSNPYDYKSHTVTYVLPPDNDAVRRDKGPLILDFGNA